MSIIFKVCIGIWTICFNLILNPVTMVSATTVLSRNLKIGNSTNIFTSYDKVSADLTQVLGTFPYNTFENCDSYIECAFRCQSEETCHFYQYDKFERKCRSLDTSLADIREDGIYTCLSPFRAYGDSTLKFCLKAIYSSKTKDQATTSCSGIGGRVAILIEDLKHTEAGAIAQSIYSASSKAVWIDATMNTAEKKWYWSDGTSVPESRFNQGTSDFYYKPTSKPCVAFIGTRYYLRSCTSTGYVMCDTQFSKL